jgi:hypothetical protein
MFQKPVGSRHNSPIYVKGWQDGCESGADASANHLYRFAYEFRQDWSLLNNPEYVQAWEKAYNHCRKYVLQHNLRKVARS